MNLLKVAEALMAVANMLKPYAPLLEKAFAAYQSGGWQALLTFLENIKINPGAAGSPCPPANELASVTEQLRAAHA